MDYITTKVYGLPKPKRNGTNTGSPHRRKEYVHKVMIREYMYFKVHIARNSGKQSKIKYFKTFQEACSFVDLLKLNPYI
jgi:hypothetical protein